MSAVKYALLDTDFVSKMNLIRDDDQNKLIDKIMIMPNYRFFCHRQIVDELIRHNIAGAPQWLEEKVKSKVICIYDDRMILDELLEIYGKLSVNVYADMLKNACDVFQYEYFRNKFILVSQMDRYHYDIEEFLRYLQMDCDTIGTGQNLGEIKLFVLLQLLKLKAGNQIHVFCSDDKNARNAVTGVGTVRCISVLSSFVRLKNEIGFTKEEAEPYIRSYLERCLSDEQEYLKVQSASRKNRMCKIPCEQVFCDIFSDKIEDLMNGNLRYKE